MFLSSNHAYAADTIPALEGDCDETPAGHFYINTTGVIFKDCWYCPHGYTGYPGITNSCGIESASEQMLSPPARGESAEDMIVGNGKMVTEEFSLSPFSAIDNTSIFDVKLIPGDSAKAIVHVEENLLKYVNLKTEGSTLNIGFGSKKAGGEEKKIETTEIPVAEIYLEPNTLTWFDNSGVGDVSGEVKTTTLRIGNSGTGDMSLTIEAEGNINLEGSGTGDSNFTIKKAKTVNAEASGTGDITLKGQAETKGQLSESGTGKINDSGMVYSESSESNETKASSVPQPSTKKTKPIKTAPTCPAGKRWKEDKGACESMIKKGECGEGGLGYCQDSSGFGFACDSGTSRLYGEGEDCPSGTLCCMKDGIPGGSCGENDAGICMAASSFKGDEGCPGGMVTRGRSCPSSYWCCKGEGKKRPREERQVGEIPGFLKDKIDLGPSPKKGSKAAVSATKGTPLNFSVPVSSGKAGAYTFTVLEVRDGEVVIQIK